MGKIAFVYPGQGSQQVGMGSDLYENTEIKAMFDKIFNVIENKNLKEVMFNGPEEELKDTKNAQPSISLLSVILTKLVRDKGITPDYVAGHSLGEYSALVAAEVLDFQDAVQLVSLRGKFMQTAVPAGIGAMAAILGMEDEAVEKLCLDCAENEVLVAVNYNSPGQIVIAGQKAAIDRACIEAKNRGAKRALPLSVSVPSHCSLMLPAAEMLTKHMQTLDFKAPKIPVLHNADVQEHSNISDIQDILAKQLYMPVRFTQTIHKFTSQNIQNIIECGSGKVLTGLIKRINSELKTYNLSSAEQIQTIITTI